MKSIMKMNTIREKLATSNSERYPYWSQVICFFISEEQKIEWEYVVSILNDRMEEKTIVVIDDDFFDPSLNNEKFRYISKNQSNNYSSKLFENTVPTLEEVYFWMDKILDIENKNDAKLLLFSMRQQHVYVDFINFLFAEDDSFVG